MSNEPAASAQALSEAQRLLSALRSRWNASPFSDGAGSSSPLESTPGAPAKALQALERLSLLIENNEFAELPLARQQAIVRSLQGIDAMTRVKGGEDRIGPLVGALFAFVDSQRGETTPSNDQHGSTAPLFAAPRQVTAAASPDPVPMTSPAGGNVSPPPRVWWPRIKSGLLRVRRIAELAIVGVILALIGLWLDVDSRFKSSKEQIASDKRLEGLTNQIADVSVETAQRVADLIGIDAAVRADGPLKDLADLAHRSEPVKQEANAKVNSGDPALAAEGAAALQKFAERRSAAVRSIAAEVAEDFREAGAAHLVAGQLPMALAAYQEAVRLDPANVGGLTTLSDVALASNDLVLAENSAQAALAYAEAEKDTNKFQMWSALGQMTRVLLAKKDTQAASVTAARWEKLIQATYGEVAPKASNPRYLGAMGVTRLTGQTIEMQERTMTVFYDGNVVTVYRLDSEDDVERSWSAIFDDTIYLIAQYELIEALMWKAEILKQQQRDAEAMAVLDEAVVMARRQVSMVGLSGVESYLWPLLEDLGELHKRRGAFKNALALYEESVTIHRRLARQIEEVGAADTEVVGLEKWEVFTKGDEQQRSIARDLEEISFLHAGLSNLPQALAAAHESVRLREQLAAAKRDTKDHERLAASLFNRAILLFESGQKDESCNDLGAARRLLADPKCHGCDRDGDLSELSRWETRIGCGGGESSIHSRSPAHSS